MFKCKIEKDFLDEDFSFIIDFARSKSFVVSAETLFKKLLPGSDESYKTKKVSERNKLKLKFSIFVCLRSMPEFKLKYSRVNSDKAFYKLSANSNFSIKYFFIT